MSQLFLILATIICGGEDHTVDFDTEVVPIFTRYGCNAGACHGSAMGRGGLKLSLFGSRPEADHQTIVNQLQGRRINHADPGRSLLLLKPTAELEHGGDHRFDIDSEAGQRIIAWIKQSANRSTERTLTRFDVAPSNATIDSPGKSVELKAFAVFSDAMKQDVTDWTVFAAEDDQSVKLDSENSTATPLQKGRHIIIARFLDHVAAIEIIVPLSSGAPKNSAKPRANFIDDSINAKLDALRIPASKQANDLSFLRRLHLDLTGSLPTPGDVRDFLRNDSPDKRERTIDKLMDTEGFVVYWTYRLGQWIRVGAKNQDAASATAYYQWLRHEVEVGRPMDQLVRTLITSTGDTHKIGPANFYRTADNARLQAEFASLAFMGVQLRCANCHDHPYDRWTQDDYHGLSAVFASVKNGRTISFDAIGEVLNPRTGEPALPKIPGTENRKDQTVDLDRLASWITDKNNEYFAKAFANRIWSNFFGRGLVEPIDDLRPTNPATHPKLLDSLAEDLQKHGFDFRRTVRVICNSAAYQRSSNALPDNQADDRFYSRMPIRDLSPEVLADAISNVTDVPETYANHSPTSKAIQLHKPAAKSELLEILGRCTDEKTCTIGVTIDGGISRQLQLINGDLLNRRISDPSGRLQLMIRSGAGNTEIVEDLYLRCLSRFPKENEIAYWAQQLDSTKTREERSKLLEDLNWSLLTCREFITNH